MKANIYLIIIFSLILLISCKKSKGKKEPVEKKNITERIEEKITSIWSEEDTIKTDSVQIHEFLKENPDFEPYRKKMYKFYSRRGYELAWYDKKGKFLPQASMFINILRNIHKEGLDPVKFNIADLEKLYKESQEKYLSLKKRKKLIHDVDLALSASYFMYSRELWKGTVHPEEENLSWNVNRKKIKFGKTLDSILAASPNGNPFHLYEPLHHEYQDLKKALQKYHKIKENGGWKNIQFKQVLQAGNTSKQVLEIRKRLAAEGYPVKNLQDSIFGSDLTYALMQFQNAHGLPQDGVFGPNTAKYLNITAEDKIRQIEINLERWRWVPDKIGKDYIMVNIPEFRLRLYENNKEALDMKVIVGKEMTHTPVFNDKLEYIVLNPYWNIPKSIAVEEILPAVRRNPAYLETRYMEIGQNWNFDKPIDPYTIDWNNVKVDDFPYQFRQKPGRGNALGHIKFLFPNNYNVYLHDTPERYLFNREERNFSHGCIRVEKPIELAAYVLRNNKDWNYHKLQLQIGGENQYIKLSEEEQMPVYILYFTVWADEAGTIHFLDDIYGHDKELEQAYLQENGA